MPRFVSRHATAISYSGVVLRPGENVVSDDDAAKLGKDANFRRHYDDDLIRYIRDDAPSAPPDPRARKPKESDKAYAARMALLDEEAAAADAKAEAAKTFLAAYDDMTPDERAAMYETLSTEEKALVDAQAAVSHE